MFWPLEAGGKGDEDKRGEGTETNKAVGLPNNYRGSLGLDASLSVPLPGCSAPCLSWAGVSFS